MSQYPRSARDLLADYGLSEGVISGVLDIHAHELAEQQRGLMVYELDWAPGHYQWRCPRCGVGGNVTPGHLQGSGSWHRCRPANDGAGPVRPDEETT
jgi:hypothetical protein